MNNTIYNYLATNNRQKTSTKNNIHKKSELRNIYKEIIIRNNQSPLYITDLSKSSKLFALQVKDATLALNESISSISNAGEDSVFSSRVATSTNDSIASAYISTSNYKTLPNKVSLQVDSLATHQINKGREVLSSSHALKPGNYSFNVNVADSIYEFQFSVTENLNNKEIQSKLIDFINSSDIGIQASLESTTNGQYNNVVLKSNTTGSYDELIFTLKDSITQIGNGIIDYYNLSNVTRHPQNSSFKLNGEQKQSMSNSFVLNKSLTINLISPSPDTVDITYSPNSEKILKSIHHMAKDYNNLINLATSYKGEHKRSSKLISDISQTVNNYKNDLESCGITIDANNLINIDNSLSVSAAKEGDFEKIFTNPTGYTNKLLIKTSDIILNPMEYLDKIMVTYPNVAKVCFPNPYITSMYSGMLFNYYC